jgi:hypothetical protein
MIMHTSQRVWSLTELRSGGLGEFSKFTVNIEKTMLLHISNDNC